MNYKLALVFLQIVAGNQGKQHRHIAWYCTTTTSTNGNTSSKYWWRLSLGWLLTMLWILCKKHTTMACPWWSYVIRLTLKNTACNCGAMDFSVRSSLLVVAADDTPGKKTLLLWRYVTSQVLDAVYKHIRIECLSSYSQIKTRGWWSYQ